MITRFYVDNFKGLREFTIEFTEPLSVIAGPNGCGKTSICQALDLLFRLARERPADIMQGMDAALLKNKWSSGSKITLEADFRIPCPDSATTLTWHLEIAKRKGWGIASERVIHQGAKIPKSSTGEVLIRTGRSIRVYNHEKREWEQEFKELPSYLSTAARETRKSYPELYALQQHLAFRYAPFLNPVFLRRRTQASELGSQGENFASYLHWISQTHRSGFKRVTQLLKRFFPTLQSLRPVRSRFGWTEIQVVHRFGRGGEDVVFKADQVNDGLLRLATIATLPYAGEGPKVIALEEPENGMHPRLLEKTVELLRSFRELGVQVIVTTHSPVLLNFVRPEEAIILRNRGPAGPEARCFAELQPGMKRLEYFDIGDVLYEVGEDKLLSGSKRRTS